MLEGLTDMAGPHGVGLMLADLGGFLSSVKDYLLIFVGLSLVIFFHELGHFMAAKACGVRVHKFAIGFWREVFGFTRGETRYSFNLLPLGGYVKMLGQEDFEVDKSQELALRDDPRAFPNKPVWQRMIIVSAGVIMNLVCAALIFMVVFMLGIPSVPAEVGWIKPGSPAEQVGIRVGDRIREVNGSSISDWQDLKAAIILSDPDSSLHITYERKDPTTGQVRIEHAPPVRPERDEEQNILQLGVAMPQGTRVGGLIGEPALPADEQLKPGDEILEVNGQKVNDFYQVAFILADLRGKFADLKVRRPVTDPKTGETKTDQRMVKWRARMNFLPEGRARETSGHLLGLVPRVRLTYVLEGDRGEQAGLKGGDVIERWGNQVAPRVDEIMKSVEQNPETDIPVVVFRYVGGKPKTLSLQVRPKVPGLLVKRRPTVGIGLQSQESDKVVVADIVARHIDGAETSAAKMKGVVPRGAEITKINGEPVSTWTDLVDRFIKLAGSEVKLAWIYEGQPEMSGTIYVPRTLGTTFDLPPSKLITAIDGRSRTETEMNGQRVPVTVDQWQGAEVVLKECVGRTVGVDFWDQTTRKFHKEQLAVTAEMVDPWTMRIVYDTTTVLTNLKQVMVQESNPFKAMMIGLHKTYYFIVQVYIFMQRMIITRSMGLEQISGPVGLIKMGSEMAAVGMPALLYFLALISANFAVINFLPLPIFDGGIFVFLIIEKIKGRPVSLKVQIATQIIGLTLIVGIFLFVTFQDIAKWLGWV